MISIVPSSLLNLAVLYPVFKVVAPAVHYDYTEDVLEDLSVPLILK
jgi:hypothetical protein